MNSALLALTLLTQTAPGAQVYSGRAGALDVYAPRVESPSISIDAHLDEPEWARAAVLTDFSQYTPGEGIPATQETEVRVFYTQDAIYFGIYVYDTEPDEILVHLTERDRSSFRDDWVRVMLDTFNDERQAYSFFVNPFGIQTDGMWLESIRPLGSPTGPKVDLNLDFIWESHGRVVEDGWITEIRIPYVSLRFPDVPVQDWGLQIARGVTRSDFKSSWAPLTLEITSVLAQSGKLKDLHGIHPKRLVELNPVTTAKVEGVRTNDVFGRGDLEPEVGLNARYGITPNLVLDATLNPDFSQVEADVDQIQVNERFALFFPEKRPFFLDGAEVFRTTQRLVHTRRIVDPIVGTKLTGKVGSFGVAYMGSVDESPSSVFGGDENALFNLVRVRRDIGAGSTVGLLYTDRTLTGGDVYNRVVSGDARLLLGGRYSLETQITSSWTATGADGESVKARPLFTVALDRSGRNFFYRAKFEDVHPDFRTLTGFIPRVGDTEVQGAVGFNVYGAPGAALERWGVELRTNNFFDHNEFWDGKGPFESEIELWPTFSFRGARNITVVLRIGQFDIRAEDYARYEVRGPDGQPAPFVQPPDLTNMLAIGVIPNVRVNEALRISGMFFLREIPLFEEASQGRQFLFSPSLEIQPGEAWRFELSQTWARMWRTSDESTFSTVNLSRVRVQYQLGRSIFARVIGQYDMEERDALRHPVTGQPVLINGVVQDETERGTFEGQALISYEPSPGTIIFAGYSRLLEGPFGYSLNNKDALQDGFFVKLSYLFRI